MKASSDDGFAERIPVQTLFHDPRGVAAFRCLRWYREVVAFGQAERNMLEEVQENGVVCWIRGVRRAISAQSAPIFRYPGALAGAMAIVGFGEIIPPFPVRFQMP